MSDKFIAFDPTTIDERPIQLRYFEGLQEIALLAESGASEEELRTKHNEVMQRGVVIDMSITWPSITEATLAARQSNEFRLPFDEVEEIASRSIEEGIAARRSLIRGEDGDDDGTPKEKSLIDRHINSRDFRLIDQSRALVAYRPTLDGALSGGVEAELHYVGQIHTKTSRVIIQRGDALPLPELFSNKKPFDKERFAKNISEFDDLGSSAAREKAFDQVSNLIENALRALDGGYQVE